MSESKGSRPLALGCDHAGLALKRELRGLLEKRGENIVDLGCDADQSCDYPDFARFLVECGIDSISLNPDSMLSTIPIVLAAEAGRSAASTSHQAARASA